MDRYVVLEYLSEGGMGAIYVGKKLGAGGFEKEVVLKQLLPEYTKQEEFIELFLREAKLSATLDHANIVHTIDLVNAGNEYFIVMEYLPGGDLRTLLRKAKRRGHRLSPGAAIYITREVLSALAYAHAKRDGDGKPMRLIHRDVSPSNVLVSQNGEVKLTDFGIAKAATHTSQFYKVKGKIGYMSPEQARSQELDHRSDLYSLAVCFYEVLTGERLFIHAGLTTSADEIYSQPVPAVSRKVPGLPQEFDKLVWKALAIDPAERYQTASELQEALMRCAHKHGLLISAPELAAQLRESCGPAEGWRDEEDEVPADAARPGTEIYDASDDDEDEDFSAMSAVQSRMAPPKRDRSIKLTVPELLQGVELTSIINNIAELMDARDDSQLAPLASAAGARPADSGAELPSLANAGPPPLPYPGPAPAARAPSSPARVFEAPAPAFAGLAQLPTPPPISANPPMPPLHDAGPIGLPPIAQPNHHHAMAMSKNLSAADDSGFLLTPPHNGFGYPVAAARPQAHDEVHDERSALRPWMVIAAILMIGAVIAAVVGLSGPDIAPSTPIRSP